MELSEPFSSQPSTYQQNILVNAEGKPLKINLQAVELEGRPKLVRTLKSSGALVVSNAKEATIILVDSTTESGKRLIRTWGHDDSKVVLEHTWVRASANVGRPLLEADNWGGAMTVDDGKPVTIDGVVVDEDELEEVEALVTKSPLPTPRVTPVDPTSQRSEITTQPLDVTRLASRPSPSMPNVTEQLPPGLPIAQPAVVNPTPSDQTRIPMNQHNDIRPQQSPALPLATQSLPYLQSTMSVQPLQSHNTHVFPPFTPQHPYTSSQSQRIPTQPFPPAGFPLSQPQITHVPSLPHSQLPSSQPPVTQPAPNMDVISAANLQNPNFATIMTIMEVVRHMDQSSWFGQNQLPPSQFSQLPTNFNASSFPVQPPATPGPAPAPSASAFQLTRSFDFPGVDVSVPSSQDYLSDATSSSWKHDSSRKMSEGFSATRKSRVKTTRRPSDEMSTSTSRKRPSTVKPANPPKRPRKGKERATSPYSSEHSEVDESIAISESSYPSNTPNSPPERPLNIVAHKKRGEIFLREPGQPLRFFVQVDLHGRHAVVANIKRNKGKIVNNIAESDYLILSPRSDTFQGLLNEATALGKSPILAAFVADCVEEGALLDETDYILDSVAKVKPVKRGRPSVLSMQTEISETSSPQVTRVKPKSSPATGEAKRSRGTPSKPLTHKNSKKKLMSTPSKPTVEAREVSAGSCSPTPPPASAREEMRNGRYIFTRAEDEYILCLAKHHLNRDPTITNNGLVSKLYQKMPHHSFGSWATHIEQKLKGAVEDIRKRANIAKRKRDSEATTRNLSQGLNDEGTASKGNVGSGGTNGDVSMHPSEATQENLEREDFEVITKFFASGGGEDDNDERVWQELEKHRACRSFKSWPEYYAAHQQEVYTRIEEMMNE